MLGRERYIYYLAIQSSTCKVVVIPSVPIIQHIGHMLGISFEGPSRQSVFTLWKILMYPGIGLFVFHVSL
jgi:hypothetical protein